MNVKIENIRINEGRREVDQSKVKELAESIKLIGLINPVTIKHDGEVGRYLLVAGMHRLEAFKILGKEEIQANIISGTKLELELIEIDENLIRNEIHYIELEDLTLRRKQIYEEMYPETKQGMRNRQTVEKLKKTDSDSLERPSFVTDTSSKTGKSETVIKEGIYRATNLIPEAKEVIKENDIPKTQATELAREEPEQQRKVIELIATGQVKKVDEAKKILDPVDAEYEIKAKEIEAQGKRVKKVQDLLNYTKYLGITELHISDYLEMFPKHHHDFISDLESLKNIADEVIEIYRTLNQIRRVK